MRNIVHVFLKKIYYYLIIFIFLISCVSPQDDDKIENFEELKPPLMGWASWNNYRININEDIIKSQADAMV